MRKNNRQLDFATSRSGVAAVEFAIIFPVLLILMLSGFQLIAFINATRKVGLVAFSISEMISQAAPPIGSTVATVNSLDDGDFPIRHDGCCAARNSVVAGHRRRVC